MQQEYFKNIDLNTFWNNSDHAVSEYMSSSPTDEKIKHTEEALGYRLPESYIWLMKQQNGGAPNKTCLPTQQETSWAKDHIEISGIFGIGKTKPNSLCGDLGSEFRKSEWGYPDIGIYICDTPSAGHDMIALDYRICGKNGEPSIVHVDQEANYTITFLAKDFETFICGLVGEEVFS